MNTFCWLNLSPLQIRTMRVKDSDEGGYEGNNNIDRPNLLSHNLNDTVDVLDVAGFAAL